MGAINAAGSSPKRKESAMMCDPPRKLGRSFFMTVGTFSFFSAQPDPMSSLAIRLLIHNTYQSALSLLKNSYLVKIPH